MTRINLPPPYRLEKADDVQVFLASHPEKKVKGWRELASRPALVRPPAMDYLPEKFHADVHILRKEFVRHVNDAELPGEIEDLATVIADLQTSVLTVAADLPGNYLEMTNRAIAEGKALLRQVTSKDRISGKESEQEYVHLRTIDGVRLLPDLLGEMLFYLLNRREAKFARFLKERLLAWELYDKAHRLDCALLENIRAEPADSSRLFQLLGGILRAVQKRRNHVFRPYMRRFLEVAERQLMLLRGDAGHTATKRALTSLKSNVFAVLQEVAGSSCDDIGIRAAEAKERLARLYSLFSEKISRASLTKFRSVTDNYLEKTRTFAEFYSRNFYLEEMERAARIFNRRSVTAEMRTVRLFTGARLWFYPCKDYMDYIKGEASGDCTTEPERASGQLLHPRFFNIRIFSGRMGKGEHGLQWIGNVYCLDYTRNKNTLVIDRIQLRKEGAVFPQRFFPIFMKILIENLSSEKELSIIAPPHMSNFSSINKSYKTYCRSLPLVEFHFSKEDEIFECSKFSRFHVLYSSESIR